MTKDELNELSNEIVSAAIEVHKQMGPGLYEEIYEECLIAELANREVRAERQVSILLEYKNVPLDGSYRLDILVENEIIVELKAIKALLPIHTAQILSYLRLADKRLGLLMNFHEPVLYRGIHRFVNKL